MTVPFIPDLEEDCEFYDDHFQPRLEFASPMMKIHCTKRGGFGMHRARFLEVSAWIHEFSEHTISMIINRHGHNPFQIVRLPAEEGIWSFTFAHMLTTISCGTSTSFRTDDSDSFIVTEPDDDWQELRERLKDYDRFVSLILEGHMGDNTRREWEARS